MTPIESTFSVSVDSKLDWETLGRILATGHSRVPVYSGDSKNLIGLLLVKSLISVRAEDETPVSAVSIRKLPCVPADTPLYDLLNEFQKGQSHMAAVVSVADRKSAGTLENHVNCGASGDPPSLLADDCDNVKASPEYSPTCNKDGKSAMEADPVRNCPEWKVDFSNDSPQTCCKLDKGAEAQGQNTEEGVIIGIITLEDVFEELIQEEIVDETDEYVDVHRRIRVTTGALPLSSLYNGVAGQYVGGGVASNDQHASVPRNAKPSGKKFSFLKAGYNLTEPLLDKT